MEGGIDTRVIRALIKEIGTFPPAVPSGHMRREIAERGFFDEVGLRFSADDFKLGLHYAGLAVLVRDMHRYLAEHPRDDAALFHEVVSLVHDEESQRFGSGAFPNYTRLPAETLPEGLAAAAAAGQVAVEPLNDRAIVHEWTFKPGKRLYRKFGAKLKETICGDGGPYMQFENGLVGQSALPTTIATTVLSAGFSAATFWYPLAAYVSVLLIKTGLKTYCEDDLPSAGSTA